MDKRIFLLAVFLVLAIGMIAPMAFAGRDKARRAKAACKDGSDNDGDGLTDWPDDPGCSNRNDASELNPNIECDDGVDNDGDDDIDYNDGGCSGPTDDDETNCGDGVCEGGETVGNCPQDCTPLDSCNDTDGGFNVVVQGTASGYNGGLPYSFTDECNTTALLLEFYCIGDTLYGNMFDCANMSKSCSSGACV